MNYQSDYQKFKAESLADSAIAREYDALEDEFRLAGQLIQARRARNLTQAQLAEKVGLKQTAIARLESGQSNPSYKTLSRVARALGKNLSLV